MITHNLTDCLGMMIASMPKRLGSMMTSKVVKALSHSIAHRGTKAALENPKDDMERLRLMNEPRWKALSEKHIVDYCAWDHPYKKPGNIWVSELGWKPTGTTGDGRCNNDCNPGSLRPDTGRWGHFNVLSGAAGTGPTGPGIGRQKNAAPALLMKEILTAAKEHNTAPPRMYVLDLFAGYGSMRAATKGFGLSYVGGVVTWSRH